MLDDRQRLRKKQTGERVFQEVFRHAKQMRIVIEAGAKRLQTAQVIGNSKSLAQLLECPKVALPLLRAERLFQPRPEILSEAIVVEQGIVDIQQKDDVIARHRVVAQYRVVAQHGVVGSFFGLCQVSSSSITPAAAAGPQVPGSYCTTGSGSFNTGST